VAVLGSTTQELLVPDEVVVLVELQSVDAADEVAGIFPGLGVGNVDVPSVGLWEGGASVAVGVVRVALAAVGEEHALPGVSDGGGLEPVRQVQLASRDGAVEKGNKRFGQQT